MIETRGLQATAPKTMPSRIGSYGHLAIFLWSLAMVMLVPAERVHWAAALCLGVGLCLHPTALKPLLCPRWLFVLALLALPPVFLLGEVDTSLLGVGVSSAGLVAALQIAMRFVVVLVAVNGFTTAVDITALAGMLERFGLQGLGFCLGVALNLLPSLQQSASNAWRSLWMRGGLRRQWWRGIRLLVVTIVSNALRHAEEVALAAEARAFSPESAHPMPIQSGRLDWLATALTSLTLLALCFAG